jgi:hypothetical protein
MISNGVIMLGIACVLAVQLDGKDSIMFKFALIAYTIGLGFELFKYFRR